MAGRRVEKKVDGYSTRYVHDGDHIIAEYDGNNNLLRKYIYGPCVDKPVCMIEVADGNATYYYHFDALGSVVALSDAAGDTVQTYQYSVYGEVAVEDANHTNPYMFSGRRFDVEIGLYYFRARYYNPFMGRFLQPDPTGYEDGMNWYAYCKNNPLNSVDPFGMSVWEWWRDFWDRITFRGERLRHKVDRTYGEWTEGEQARDERKKEREEQVRAVCGNTTTELERKYSQCIDNAEANFDKCIEHVNKSISILESMKVPEPATAGLKAIGYAACQGAQEIGERYCDAMKKWCLSGGKGDKPDWPESKPIVKDLWPGDRFVMPEEPPTELKVPTKMTKTSL